MNADTPHIHLAPEERKSVIDALIREIDKTQKWTRLVAEMQAEIARLRLTDAERDALKVAVKWCKTPIHPVYSQTSAEALGAAATLKKFLKRTK